MPITTRDRAADDMALLRQYVDEDSQDAFTALLDRHASWIHASARRALRTRDLADDATQTVFVILARKAPSIAPNVRVSGWLYHTTR
ncbi:MAG: sigma-70 family RNA polymerase sigma factor, partial [Anaerolineae bacterium]|nr:sigma-70 family RNA polymerase sigma factor [Phycisphaerae bacterium]